MIKYCIISIPFPETNINHDCKRKGYTMGNKEKKPDNQFKENTNHGEHRNGRLAQFKNHNEKAGEEPNEYISKKDEE